MNQQQTEHDEIIELLPWYINGSLSQSEKDRVEAALQQSSELRQEANLLKQVLNQASASEIQVSEQEMNQQFDVLMNNINKQPKRQSISGSGKTSDEKMSLGEMLQALFTKPWIPTLGTAALVAVVALQFNPQWVSTTPSKAPDFATHSGTQSERVENITLKLKTKLASSEQDILNLLPEGFATVSVSKISKQEFDILIPATVDSQQLNKLLFSLTSNTKVEHVKMDAEE